MTPGRPQNGPGTRNHWWCLCPALRASERRWDCDHISLLSEEPEARPGRTRTVTVTFDRPTWKVRGGLESVGWTKPKTPGQCGPRNPHTRPQHQNRTDAPQAERKTRTSRANARRLRSHGRESARCGRTSSWTTSESRKRDHCLKRTTAGCTVTWRQPHWQQASSRGRDRDLN